MSRTVGYFVMKVFFLQLTEFDIFGTGTIDLNKQEKNYNNIVLLNKRQNW